MTWHTVLKGRPFLTEDEVKFAGQATAAQMASIPMEIEDSIKSKKQLTRLINKIQRYEGEEFEEKFQQTGWDASDREEILQLLKDTRDGLSQPTKENQSHIADKIRAFLDGNHDALLELVENTKNRAMAHLIQQWNKKNGDELREYLKDKPDLAEKFKQVFKRLEPIEEKKKQVSPDAIGDDLVYDYVKMVVNDLKLPSKGDEIRLGKTSYLPITHSQPNLAIKVYGLASNQSGNLPPATAYILKNEDVDLEQFLAVADTKTSTKKEIILNRLRSSKVGGAIQDAWDNSETLSGFENTVAADRNLTKDFKELMEALGSEMKVEDITTEVKFSIPAQAYEKMMAEDYDDSLKVYGINSEDALEEMMDEHREDLASFKEKVSGFYRPVDGETKNRLENSEVLKDEGIELWDSEGRLKELSSSMASGKAFPQYLQTLAEAESPNKIILEAAEGNKNQVMIGDFVLYMVRIEQVYEDRDSEVKEAVYQYTVEQSEENKERLTEALSSTQYGNIRTAFLDAIKKKMSELLSDYNSNYLHEKNTVEPLEWLWERT